MTSKTTLNAKNLEVLGAERLAELLIEISAGSATAQRRLRLELAALQSPAELAKAIRKRLTTIARSRSFVDRHEVRALAGDLETQRRAIADRVAKTNPDEALDLMWRFLALANPVFGRCDDSDGAVGGIFAAACGDLGRIAKQAKSDQEVLAGRVFTALNENDYAQYDDLIPVLAELLGPVGLDRLKAQFIELSKTPVETPRQEERKVIGWGSGGPLYADEIAIRQRASAIRLALEQIADAQGDVDAFIAQQSGNAKSAPSVAAEIASRLLAAGRAEEAWSAIEAVDKNRPGWIPFEWEQTRLEVLEALGRTGEAQAFRWECFERALEPQHLRAYLKRLPDFDDIETEERALSYALGYGEVHRALLFLVTWPSLEKASALALRRSQELNGNHYEILAPAADALAAKHPLAATILLRAMIDFTLEKNRSSRYRHAARHLAECASLASSIAEFGDRESHAAYVTRLRAKHGRKSSFWILVD
ncbi:MAG: DUF6880 family protein [Hyphomicrobiales bacterium]